MSTAALRLYTVFHLNLAFSSVEEEQHAQVIERCYRPLLALARDGHLPVGLEASGWTLERIAELDPGWLEELRALVARGRAEFVGSGYVQLIGPLVPARVNRWNLALGHATYERLLGRRPTLALVNEQAWSASLVPLYREAGYEALVMEWENPAALHPGWPRELGLRPQRALGADGSTLPVLWNHSIAFQKFQRLAHGDLEPEELLEYLRRFAGREPRALALYGGDAEVFDFRPGRYRTEAALPALVEWDRIRHLAGALAREPGIELALPSDALALLDPEGPVLPLGDAEQPVPVKKQAKYTLSRWAITGRDDLGLNSACWRRYRALAAHDEQDPAAWRDLCTLWASDLRTHVTPRRWAAARARLAPPAPPTAPPPRHGRGHWPDHVQVRREGRVVVVETPELVVRLNRRRGLAVDACTVRAHGDRPLYGSLPHGYFADMSLSADQYTGFLVLAALGQPQVTDLEAVEPELTWDPAAEALHLDARIGTPLGPIEKRVTVAGAGTRVGLRWRLHFAGEPLGTLRLGHLTLRPEGFDRGSLFYATHLGGDRPEAFPLGGRTVDHTQPASHLVSCRTGLGMTEGLAWLGDATRAVRVETDPATAALFGLVTCRDAEPAWFARLTLSARELDDTSRPGAEPMVAPLAGLELAVAFADGTAETAPLRAALGAAGAAPAQVAGGTADTALRGRQRPVSRRTVAGTPRNHR